ncbi:response regulator [Clostridium manihotivorum]|uniref:Stage 0 sporulation protein A homolog n=1 Tax=Clostridium manihotivorum TaxID=2320868 RepID=A0A3R5TIC5_9CLOT|nr:response regulator [Clostridium manihotivorum]QAA34145.1 response regulator [Clostridium manihotivorum]
MKKVLVVDDTKNIREMLKTYLDMEGFHVFEAINATEAIEIIKNEDISIVFTDIKMPEVSGTELLRLIKKYNKSITVIVMTAFGTIKNAVECTKLGAAAYLQKPFTSKRVKAVLDEVLKKDSIKNNLIAHLTLAKKLIDENELEKAEEVLKKTLTIKDDCGETYYLISKLEELKGDMEKANRFRKTAEIFQFECNLE